MALAFGGDFYTPPPLPAMLRHDLKLLPIWMADTDDAVMADNVPAQWIRQTATQINGVCTNIVARQDIRHADYSFSPWGWSPSLRRELVAAGANDSSLPSRDRIEQIRELSHRRSSIIIHNAVNQAIGYQLAPTPVELHSFEAVRQFAAANPGCFRMAPWSSSGKGIFCAVDADAPLDKYEVHGNGALVVVEIQNDLPAGEALAVRTAVQKGVEMGKLRVAESEFHGYSPFGGGRAAELVIVFQFKPCAAL